MNQLPLEIYHFIFDYLHPFDIFNGFVSLNQYIDDMVYSYNRLKLDFRSISKSKFDFICQRLQGEQVQSLILSNDENSPGQIDLFFSFFSLYSFIHLQSIELNEIFDSNFLHLIFSHLENHSCLQSVTIRTTSMFINKNNSRQLMEIFASFPKLRTLKYYQSASLIDLRHPLIHLRHLIIDSCQLNHLNIILPWTPHLISLNINVVYHLNDRLTAPTHILLLKSLIIRCRQWTTFVDIENFLSQCPSLQCLIIETMGDVALLNGNEWKRLIQEHLPHLKRIELNISPDENHLSGNDVLLPFQNPFWTIEKQLQFVCNISTVTNGCVQLFTVPYFNPQEIAYPSSQGFFYYSIHSYPIEQNCTGLSISSYPIMNSNTFIFSKVKVLSLDVSFDQIEQISSILHLSTVSHLKLSKSIRGHNLVNLLHHGSNIHQLTLYRQTLFEFIQSISSENESISFSKIQILHLNDSTPTIDYQSLSQLFSHLENIYFYSRERNEIVEILQRFSHIKNVHFRWLYKDQLSTVVSQQWLEDQGFNVDKYSILNKYQCDLWLE